MSRSRAGIFLGCAIVLCACANPGPDPANPPKRLSDWGVLDKRGDALVPAGASFAYSLHTPLFSDYAEKFRTVWMPEGERARQRGDQVFDFPVGTIISKTFFYRLQEGLMTARDSPFPATGAQALDTRKVRLLETRLLVHAASGWIAVPYVWSDAQDEAYLNITGELLSFDVRVPGGQAQAASYLIPSRNQCASCHARRNSGGLHPIGPKAWNVDLDHWRASGWLDSADSVAAHAEFSAARRYLDVNCAHCHSEEGAGDTSGLFLDIAESDPIRLGVCKRTIAAGQGTGGRTYGIVPGKPDESILVYRMNTTSPAEMMPELGRSLVHSSGVSLLRDWIAAMPEVCASSASA